MKIDSMLSSTLETKRLLLRPPIKDDFEEFAQMQADPEVKKYIGEPISRAKAWATFCAWWGEWSIHGYSFFSVIEKSSGKWIGRCGPVNRDNFGLPELGWALFGASQGKGYALEAASVCLDWAIEKLGWQQCYLFISSENEPSRKLARKMGFEVVARIDHPFEFHSKAVETWKIEAKNWKA